MDRLTRLAATGAVATLTSAALLASCASPDDRRASALKADVTSMMQAVLDGRTDDAAVYLDPAICGPDDVATLDKAATELSTQYAGSWIAVYDVEVDGDRGRVTKVEINGPASAVLPQNGTPGDWAARFDNNAGRWFLNFGCDGADRATGWSIATTPDVPALVRV